MESFPLILCLFMNRIFSENINLKSFKPFSRILEGVETKKEKTEFIPLSNWQIQDYINKITHVRCYDFINVIKQILTLLEQNLESQMTEMFIEM